ncbi:MAG TPA: iron-sulfur cluster assembly accessory protein [Rhizomicrobium sp.]
MSTETALPVTVSPRAAKRIAEIIAAEGRPAMLRLAVAGGGCSGFQYTYAIVPEAAADDLVLAEAGAKVAIDQVSLGYLLGSKVDFVDDLMGRAFKIQSPAATASCGCGTSFSLD